MNTNRKQANDHSLRAGSRKSSAGRVDKASNEIFTWRDIFHRFSQGSARVLGSAWAFVIAIVVIVVWAVTGPIFHFSDTWQLVINTGTTIVTFLMVFVIQNTQNRDARALHLKLDELLRAITEARTGLVDLEDLSEEEIDRLEKEFKRVREENCKIKDQLPAASE